MWNVQTPRFIKVVKRLQSNQKRDLDEAVRAVAENPAMGDRKAGDLAWVRVYKFRMLHQLTLLAYEHAEEADTNILHGWAAMRVSTAISKHYDLLRRPVAIPRAEASGRHGDCPSHG